jgi:DinB superfamily
MLAKQLETFLNHRIALVSLLNELQEDTINKIPQGYNNNIVWNVGHIISVHQLIAYGLSDLPYKVDKETVMRYRKNTKPEETVTLDEFKTLCNTLVDSVDAFKKDYEAGKFASFKSFTAKSIDTTYDTIEDIVHFLILHDSIHVTTIKNYLTLLK